MGLHREPNDRTALFLKIANRMAKRGLICVDWIRDARPAFALAFSRRRGRTKRSRTTRAWRCNGGFVTGRRRR